MFEKSTLITKRVVYRKWEIEGYATHFFGDDKQLYPVFFCVRFLALLSRKVLFANPR